MTQPLNAPLSRAFIDIRDLADLDRLIEQSHAGPIVIFKHSPVCGTSAQAFDELDDFLSGTAAVDIHVVNVLTSRPLSQAIAQRFGVRHESPQLLVLRDGAVLWHGSHYSVTVERVRQVLDGEAG